MAHTIELLVEAFRECLAHRRRLPRPMFLIESIPLSGTTYVMRETLNTACPDARVVSLSAIELVGRAHSGTFATLSPYETWVVVLDDLSPADLLLLEPDVLDMVTSRAIVLASMNHHWCTLFLNDTARVTAKARIVLDQYARRLRHPFEASFEERRHALRAFPGISLGSNIAESLVGAHYLLQRYEQGRTTCPSGHWLVAAMADLRRAGVHRGLSQAEISVLFQRAVAFGPDAREKYIAAMAWAAKIPEGASMGMLVPRPGGGQSVLSYIAGAEDGYYGDRARDLTPATWMALIRSLPHADAFNLGVAAHLRQEPQIADAALYRASQNTSNMVIAAHALAAMGR